MQLQALLFAVVASLLCVPAVLSAPQPKEAKVSLTVPKAGSQMQIAGFKDLKDVEISFPPQDPSGSCQICDDTDGCTAEDRKIFQYSWTTENMYAYRADSEESGWWAAQMNRTFDRHHSFAIVNNLKPKTRANLFEIVTIDYQEEDVSKQNVSVWTKVEPMTSCLTNFQGSMKYWQQHMTIVNVYQSVHPKKGKGASS